MANIEKQNDWSIFMMPDKINAGNVNELEPDLIKASENTERLMLDFLNVKYIDSTGIGCLINFYGITKKKNIKLVIANCRENVLKIFKLVNLTKFIPVFSSRDDAFKALG